MNILVVVAHPDDEVYAAGGLIAKAVRLGHFVEVVCLTPGVGARFPVEARANTELTVAREIRRKEADAAAQELGYDFLAIAPFADQRLEEYGILALAQYLEGAFDTPDLLITHNPNDLNKDHRVCYEASMVAFRKCRNVLAAEPIPYALTSPTPLNAYCSLTDVDADAKMAALDCYKSEAYSEHHPLGVDTVASRMLLRGAECGAEFAEAFTVIRQEVLDEI